MRFAATCGPRRSRAAAAPAATAWTWPADGPCSGRSCRAAHPYAAGQHRGIDVGGSTGDRVLAPAAGASPSPERCRHYGRSLTITHGRRLRRDAGPSRHDRRGAWRGRRRGRAGRDGRLERRRSTTPRRSPWHSAAAEPHGYIDPLALLPPRRSHRSPPRCRRPLRSRRLRLPWPPSPADPRTGPPTAPTPSTALPDPGRPRPPRRRGFALDRRSCTGVAVDPGAAPVLPSTVAPGPALPSTAAPEPAPPSTAALPRPCVAVRPRPGGTPTAGDRASSPVAPAAVPRLPPDLRRPRRSPGVLLPIPRPRADRRTRPEPGAVRPARPLARTPSRRGRLARSRRRRGACLCRRAPLHQTGRRTPAPSGPGVQAPLRRGRCLARRPAGRPSLPATSPSLAVATVRRVRPGGGPTRPRRSDRPAQAGGRPHQDASGALRPTARTVTSATPRGPCAARIRRRPVIA